MHAISPLSLQRARSFCNLVGFDSYYNLPNFLSLV